MAAPAGAHVTGTPSVANAGVVHRPDHERPARLRRLADHRGRDPDPRVGALGHPDAQPALRPRGRTSSSSTSRSPTPTATRSPSGSASIVYTANDPAARGPARHLRAVVPGARRGRRDARLPDHPDLRAGRDRLDRGARGGSGRRGAGAPGAVVRGAAGRRGGRRPRREPPPTRRRPTPRRPPTTPGGDDSSAARLGRARSSARSACSPAAPPWRGAARPRDAPRRRPGGGSGPARLAAAVLRRAAWRCWRAPHRPSAHAQLTGTDPADGARARQGARSQVTLSFNEPVRLTVAGDHRLRRRRRQPVATTAPHLGHRRRRRPAGPGGHGTRHLRRRLVRGLRRRAPDLRAR